MPRPRGKTKQTRLSFNPPAAASQDNNNTQRDPGDQKSRHANLRYGHPSLATVRRGKLPSAAPPPPPPPADTKSKEDEESAPFVREKSPAKAVPEKKKTGGFFALDLFLRICALTLLLLVIPVDKDSDSDSDSDLEIAPSKHKKEESQQPLKRKRSREQAASEDEESDPKEVINPPRRKLRRGAASKPVVLDDDDEEEDHASRKPEKSEEEKEEEENDDDDDEPIIATPAKRKRNIVTEDPQTPRRGSDQDQIDIEEDLEDLQDSVVKETRTRGRLANSARSTRQQHLETLRRRRAGEATDSGSDEPERIEEEEESDSEGSLPRDTSATYQTRIDGLQPENSDVESAIASNEDLDRYDEDFVSEDENDPLGVPAAGIEEMPLEFTRHAYKQTKEYFRDAVEWMVHNQLNPAFSRSAPLYKVAFGKLEDEVKGRTGSQLISSVWNAGFHRALVARPHIEVTLYLLLDNHPCDACNRSGHPASADIKLYGKAYSLDTLEAISDDDSDDDDDDDEEHADKKETDRDGNILPDQKTRFFLGRYVMLTLGLPQSTIIFCACTLTNSEPATAKSEQQWPTL